VTAQGLATVASILQGYVRMVSEENFLDPEVLITFVKFKEKRGALLRTLQVLYATPKMLSFHFYPIPRWSLFYSKQAFEVLAAFSYFPRVS
jgi:hypothetical protein